MRRIVAQVCNLALYLIKKNRVVDALGVLEKSISEVSKDHKDCFQTRSRS